MRVLKESGFDNVVVVEEQKKPDGNFPTCPYPNPEIKEALSLGLERKLQNSNTTSKDESLCNAIDNALNLLKEADLVL